MSRGASCAHLHVTDKIRYMEDVGDLSLDELTALSRQVARELRLRRPPDRTCAACGRRFAARKDAKYCSSRCRVAVYRLRQRKERNVSISGIGYEGSTLDDILSQLRLRGVKTLVDVRLNAISRKRGFSKRALTDALAASGIAYLHMPALGNQRDNRAGYGETSSAVASEARDRFRRGLESEAAEMALVELVRLAREGDIAVFCYEKDEKHCHREQVLERVRRLLERDLVEV